MTLTLRIFLAIFLIVGAAAYFLFDVASRELRPGGRHVTEESLVDTAQLLAEIAREDFAAGRVAGGRLAAALAAYPRRTLQARIGEVTKSQPTQRVYVTDAQGIVLLDSWNQDVGRDFSRWNDVARTLRGEYGARTSRSDPADEATAVMYVAAPVRDGARIVGVVTVGKPTASLEPFIAKSEDKLARSAALLVGLSLLMGLAVSVMLGRSIARLARYAKDAAEGRRRALPMVRTRELVDLGNAIETMRTRLEGRDYVERYVQTLTHEMKSPLSAVRAAAELLEEDPPPEDRRRFAANVAAESERLQHIIDRMLALARVEQRREPEQVEDVDPAALVAEVVRNREPRLSARALTVHQTAASPCTVRGERFLLEQAVGNLLDNAIDFSPDGAVIDTGIEVHEGRVRLCVRDRGSGIPDYALPRVFERFYSLPRPAGGRKSTGLGLTFVREVAQIHAGTVVVDNYPDGGCVAVLTLPLRA